MSEPPVDKILEARLASMGSVLTRLQQLSSDVTAARKGLDDLQSQIEGMATLLQGVLKRSSEARTELQNMYESMQLFEGTGNKSFLVTSGQLKIQFDNAEQLRSDLVELRESVSVNTSTAIRRLRRWTPLRDSKLEIDAEKANQLADTLRDAVGQARPWPHYLDEVQGTCEKLFAQYVDLVGGIALRDHGLDPVSRYADALVPLLLSSFGGPGALAVPARNAPEALIQARYVRIPLPPGWTLWSLPLVARGVGELLRASRLSHAASAEFIPDVFGTFVLGPAYAFAALLLELDPRTRADQLRAQAIMYVLHRLDEDDDNTRFTALAGQLAKEWAVVTAAAQPAGPVPGPVAPAPGPPEATLRGLYDQVRQHCDSAAYLAREQWDQVEQLSADIQAADTQQPLKAELRDILNAMWLARWQHPEDLAQIEKRATRAAEPTSPIGGGHGGDSPSSARQGNR